MHKPLDKLTTAGYNKIAVKIPGVSMADEARESRHIKIRPSSLQKAHHRAIESQKRLEEAIKEKIERKEKKVK